MAFDDDMNKADRIVNFIIKVAGFLQNAVTAVVKLPLCRSKVAEKN